MLYLGRKEEKLQKVPLVYVIVLIIKIGNSLRDGVTNLATSIYTNAYVTV